MSFLGVAAVSPLGREMTLYELCERNENGLDALACLPSLLPASFSPEGANHEGPNC